MYTKFLQHPDSPGADCGLKCMYRVRAIVLQQPRVMPHLLADRFVLCRFRLDRSRERRGRARASGARRFTSNTARVEQPVRGARRSAPPAISPLIDYGMADAHRTFEAYLACDAIRTDPATGARLMNHAARFLAAHDVYLLLKRANYVFAYRQSRAHASVCDRSASRCSRAGIRRDSRRTGDRRAAGCLGGGGYRRAELGLRTFRSRPRGRLASKGTCRWPPRVAPTPVDRARSAGRHVCVFRGDDGREQPAVAVALGTPRRRRRSTSHRAVVRSWTHQCLPWCRWNEWGSSQ